MSFSEWSNNKKKKQEEERNQSQKNNTQAVLGNKTSFSEWSDYKVGIQNVNADYIDGFTKDTRLFLFSSEEFSRGVDWHTASKIYKIKSDEADALSQKSNNIRNWLNYNKDKIDAEKYKNLSEALDAYDEKISTSVNYFKEVKDHYSQWKTEAEYKEAVKISELYNMSSEEIKPYLSQNQDEIDQLKTEQSELEKGITAYNQGVPDPYGLVKTYDDVLEAEDRVDELEVQIKELESSSKIAYTTSGGQNITWQDLYDTKKEEEEFDALYEKYSANDDWEKNSKYITTNKKGTARRNSALDSSVDWNYEDVNKSEAWIDYGYASVTTPEEKAIFNYLYHTEGEEAAFKWHKSREAIYKERMEGEALERVADFAKEYPFLASGVSTAINLLAPMEHSLDTAKYFFTGELDDNSLSRMSSTIRGTVTENRDWNVLGYDVHDFLYNSGMSMLDSYVASQIPYVGAAVLGQSAAASATNDALDRGMSDSDAFWTGAAAGGFETLFESWSIGKFKAMQSGVSSGGKAALKNIVKSMAVNASEEFATEIANIAYDRIANGEFSQYETSIRAYMASGMTESEATGKVVANEISQVIEAAASGAITGIGFGAIAEGGNAIGSTIKGKQIKNASKAGGLQIGDLVDIGKSLGEGTESYKLANKITDKSSAYAIGTLYGIEGIEISEANRADIVKSLERKGYDTATATQIADIMLDSKSDKFASVALQNPQTFSDIILNPKSTVSQRTRAYDGVAQSVEAYQEAKKNGKKNATTEASVEKLAKEYEAKGLSPAEAKAMAEKQLADAGAVQSSPTAETAVESKYEVADDGKTTNIKTGKEVKVNKIESISSSGEANLTLDDGMVVSASDIAFSTPAEANFVSVISDIKIGKKPISTDSANLLYMAAMSELKNNPNMTANDAVALIKGLEESYIFGAYNFGKSGLTAKSENGSAKLLAGELTQKQRDYAYGLGAKDRDSIVKAEQKAVDKKVENAKANKTSSSKSATKKGKVSFEDGVAAKSKLQKRTVALAKHLAKALGIDIVFYDAMTANNPHGKDSNGYYDVDTDTIYLDIQNSWDDAKTITYTLSHELVHFIKKWSPAKFDTFAKFLMKQYGKHGVDASKLLDRKMAELKTQDRELAYEEMIADACETMLLDSNAIYKLMELRKTDLKLFEKIKLHIHELLNTIRNMYKKLGLSPTSDEAKALLEMKAVLGQIYSMFEDAAVDAAQSYQAVQNSNETVFGEESVDIGKTESGVKNQLKNHKKIGEDATAYNNRHKNVHEAVLKVGIESMYEMAETMLPYLEVEGILPPDIPGKTIFKNGSYGKTGENTTLCVRTLTYEDFKDRVAEELGRPLTVSESLLVSQKIYDIATDPQCIYCYVAADRKAYDGYLGEYWKAMDKYIKAMRKGGDSKALYVEYLAGRKDTAQQQKRWSQWEAIAKSGKEYISAKDLTTKRKRDALIAKKNAFSEQIKDAQRYAQSASWAKTVFDYRAYKGDILKMTSKFVDMLNSEYGLRMYSFSDYTPAFIVENMQMIIDASVKGLKSLAYTKDTDYAEIFASTGQAINVSCFAKWDAELGTYVEDNRQGANWEKTKSLRKQYRNVGAVMVATNDAMVEWALKQDWVDVVIPYHIVKTGTTIANEYQWNNYTSESADRVGNKTANIYPTEHNNDFATYSNLLNERGITPRFSRWYDKVASGELTESQYMKLVNEVRLPASELSAVVPTFNLEAAKNSFGIDNEGKVIKGGFVDKGGYMGGWYREGVDVNQEVMAVSEDIKAGKSSLDVDYGMSKTAKEKVEEKYTHSIKKQAKKSSANPYQGKTMYVDSDIYDYAFMTSLDPMKVETMPPLSVVKENGKVSQEKAVKLGLANAKSIGRRLSDEKEQYAIKNAYTQREIILGKKGLGHSLDASKIHRLRTNARLSAIGAYIVQNAVPINGLKKENPQANGTYAMACLVNDGRGYVVAVVTVDEFASTVVGIDVVDSVHSVNGRFLAKKEDSQSSSRELELGQESLSTIAISSINIADFLEIVNSTHRSILSNDVLRHFDLERPSDGYYTDRVLFQKKRDSDGHKLSEEQVEFFKDSKVRDEKGRLLAVYHGTKSAGFTRFTKTDEIGYFFARSLKTAQTYSNNSKVVYTPDRYTDTDVPNEANYQVYLNIKKPYIIDGKGANWNGLESTGEKVHLSIKTSYWGDDGKGLGKIVFKYGGKTYSEIVHNVNEFDLFISKHTNPQLAFACAVEMNAIADKNGKGKFEVDLIWDFKKRGNADSKNTRDIVRRAYESHWDYDGVIFKNVVDSGNGTKIKADDLYVAFNSNQIKSTANTEPTSGPDIRYQKKRNVAPITSEDLTKLEKRFGTTGNFRVAGYLLTDGKLLDFSGKHWGDTTSKMRQVDHRDVQEVLDDRGDNGVGAMVDMIGNGNIRLMPETGGINLAVYPNEKQRRVLSQYINYMLNTEGQIVIDYDAVGGDTVYSKEYGKTATSKQILSDIRNYFSGGRQSELMQFHTMYQKKTDTKRTLLANSLESAAQNDVERRKLAEYKEKIALIEAEEGKLAEIQKRLFTKGEVDPTERKALQFEAKQLSNRINTYDRQLLNLEATTALKNVLNREKALAAKRQKQKDNEALKKYKEKVAETQRELMNRYQDSRKRATESRHRTALREKIKKTVNELNTLLLKGSKERNVKLGLQDSVAKALEAINMDTVGADERVAKYNDLIAKAKDPDVIASLTETRDRIAAQGDRLSDKLEAMRKAYAEIRNNSKEYAPYYQQEAQLIETAIEKTIDKVGDTSIRNMTLEQLEAVYDMYKVVLQTIRYANELHNEGKVEELRDNASAMMTELEKIKTLKEERAAIGDLIREFTWNEMTPIYAIRRTGSKTLEKFYWEMIRGQSTYAQDLDEANEFKAAIREKYGHSKWNLNKVYGFELKDGRTFRLTLEHMMSIYAYSKRPQAIDHMSVGGFFFNDKATFRRKGGLLKMIKSNEAGYTVDVEMLNTIKDEMEKVAKGSTKYVDEMQDYLTKMGNKGNEVSRVVWGIDIFKEKIYFPLKSVKDFIFQANQPSQETSLKHDGMTKETKPGASNPIVLESFDDVWAGHVERMSQYHGFVIPIDNMNKLLNYGSWAGTDSISVSTMLRARFGDAVNEYFNQFIKDMNGASSASGAKNPFFSMVGKFKKTAVAASMSVVAQQPTAILRAAAVLDSRYFIGLPKAHLLSTKWSELKRYAPIAIIKDIGGFDAGGGRQVAEWLNSDARRGADKVLGKIDDITMWGAAVGDQVGWCAIWEAVKRETKAKHKDLEVGSEAFLKIAGERFTEVIVLTQVYDSTLSRSGYMRSKHDSVKMLTAFMGEPTVSINMQFDALLQAKRGTITKRKAGRILGATYAATIAASIAASLIYALRDDDEDESYLEKFAEAFGEKLIGDIIPLNQLPAVRDIISIFEGWDVERTDMAVFKDIKDAFDGLFSENKSTWRKVEDFAGAVASIFGVPLKNLLRTGREIYNGYNDIFDGIEPKDVDDAFVRGIKGEKKDKSKALYDAIVSGDEARIEVYRSQYEDDDAYMNAVKDAIAKNNPEVTQTASDLINGDFDSYQDMVDELVRLGFDRNVAADAIKSIISKVKSAAQSEADGDTEAYEEKVAELLELGYDEQQLYRDIASMDASPSNDEDLAESIFSKDNYVTAVINGDPMAETIKQDLIDAGVENGKTEEEVTKSLNNALNNAYKKEYYNGNMSDYEVDSWMKVMYPDDTDADRYWSAKRWKAQAEHLYDEDYSYSKYDDFYEAILDGDTISMNRFIAECRKYNNYKKDVNKEVASDIASAITSHFKPIYREASPQERAILKRKLLNAYAALGYAKSKRSDLIDKWLED